MTDADAGAAPLPPTDEEARLARLTPDEVEGDTRTIFDTFMRTRGNVPNLFRVAAHRPRIVQTLHAHMQAVMGPGEVSVLLKELLSVRVSLINDCDY
jgi:alkylhydroperoxidase family enzyme